MILDNKGDKIMKALVLADLQGVNYEDWKSFMQIDRDQFDVVFLLGDIDQTYLEDLSKSFQNKRIIGVHGNHDYAGDLEYYKMINMHGITLEMNGKVVAGIEGSCRYKEGDYVMLTQAEAILLCKELPYADILLTHNSPRGVHDKSDPAHQGFVGLLDYISRKKPKYLLHGHQHANRQTKIEDTLIIGVFGGVIVDFESLRMMQVLHVVE
jgi:Icc-related predicted phosphoesterase